MSFEFHSSRTQGISQQCRYVHGIFVHGKLIVGYRIEEIFYSKEKYAIVWIAMVSMCIYIYKIYKIYIKSIKAITIVFGKGSSLAVCHSSHVKFTHGTEFHSSSMMA